MPLITCVVCHAGREMPASKGGGPRTPQRWKVLREQAYCPTCKKTAYSLRAVILPVSGPEEASWAELRAELRNLWAETTRCANWIVSELYARDVRRQPDDDRLSPMRHVYLYPEARALYPRLPAQAVASLVHDVQRCYRASRYPVLWSRSASLPTYRYPVGLAIPTQAWSLHEQQGRWVVSVRLSESRWRLLLRGGPAMHRQAVRLRQIADGEAERGSLTLYESPAGQRHARVAGSSGPRVMVKIAAWLPKVAAGNRGGGAVLVHTDQHSLLACEPRWRIDPAPLRAVLAAETRRRASLLTNLQASRTPQGRKAEGIERALNELSRRSRQRLADACRTYAAHLVAHVAARGTGEVHYDDRVRPDLVHFPWEQLRRRVAEKLGERGIHFVHLNGPASTDAAAGKQDGEHAA